MLQSLFYTRLIVAIVALGVPSFAHADILSFLSGLFSNHPAVVSATVITSQNMSLLQAPLDPSPAPARGGGDITVVGDTALLPETGPSGSMADIENGSSGQISLYVVRSGDTLSQIAKMFGVSVNTIIWANDVTPSTLKPGDQLVILPISGIQYQVKAKDTLKSVAAKYKADQKEIVQFNGIDESAPLAVGSVIIIPDGELAVVPQSSSRTTSPLHGAGGPDYKGYYIPPLASYVKTQGLHGYNAVDLGAPIGTPIMAAAAGVVIVSKTAGWNGGYGAYIVIAHDNDTQTLYSHMSNDISYAGMKVFQGQIIGYVGETGKATGPHLHFEVRGAKNPF